MVVKSSKDFFPPVVVLAAGKGKRLEPLTHKLPKALAPVVNMPIIERIIRDYIEAGAGEFIVVVSYPDGPIRDYLTQEAHLGVTLRFAYQKEKLGMAHALLAARDMLTSPWFIVAACDNLYPLEHLKEIADHWRRSESDAVLSLMKVPLAEVYPNAIVKIEKGRIRKIVEKPNKEEVFSRIISLPFYLFPWEILSFILQTPLSPRGEFELQDAIQWLIDSGFNVQGVLTAERHNLTTLNDLILINRIYMEKYHQNLSPDRRRWKKVTIIDPVYIAPEVEIGEGSEIGPWVVVGRGCGIGRRVKLSESVVIPGAVVGDDLEVVHKVVI
ncbi:MAG: NDP-sugar synthase [Candidatus Aminicenantes bacterium]|nr:NDP-sugar synthase [Candidatus Aminicenantes bacterium]